MSPPAVSVVLPVFNAAATLPAALDSLRAQSFTDWECIICDDGSADNSREIAMTVSAADRRFRVLTADHAGIVAALQRGCAEVRGHAIARMDADDIAHPARIEKQVSIMERDERIGICGTCVRIPGPHVRSGLRRYEHWINSLTSHDDLVRELFIECPIPHPTFLIRRDFFEAVGGYQEHGWPEDYDLVLRLWEHGCRLAKTPEVLLDWHESAQRHSRVAPRYAPAEFRRLKRHYLFRNYLHGRRVFHQWGAGEVGKPWLREWEHRRPEAVVDIRPGKLHQRIHGCPVIPPDALPPPGATFILIAVGTLGARALIRNWLSPRGYVEARDYVFLA